MSDKTVYFCQLNTSTMSAAKPPLTNLQLEILKLYAHQLSEAQLLEIKTLLGRYFAQKATEAMDLLVAERNLNTEDLKNWANEHNRATRRH